MSSFRPFGGFGLRGNQLFSNSVSTILSAQAGVFLEPKDSATRFQDVHASVTSDDGDPVAALLDKSQRLQLGPQLCDNVGGPFTATTYWTAETSATVVVEDGLLKGANTAATNRHVYTDIATTAGELIEISTQLKSTAAMKLYAYYGAYTGVLNTSPEIAASDDWVFVKLRARATASIMRISFGPETDAQTWYIRSLSARKVLGNHAFQTVSAARPTYVVDGNSNGYLSFDGIDDALGMTLADYGTDATKTVATDSAVTQSTDQTISGAFSIPDADPFYGLVITEDPLSVTELEIVRSFLAQRSGN